MPLSTMIAAQIRKTLSYSLFQRTASFNLYPSLLAQHFSTAPTEKEAPKQRNHSESVASFLKQIGLSDTQLERVFERRGAELVSSKLEKTVKPSIQLLRDSGFSYSEIAQIVSKEPYILCCSPTDRLVPSLRFLTGLLSSRDDLFKVLKRFGWFLTRDVEKYVSPNIEILNGYGVPKEHILRHFRALPRSLCITSENLRKHIDKLESLGLNASSKMYIHAFRVVGSMSGEVWEQRMLALKDLGFTEREIVYMFRRQPLFLLRSCRKLKQTTEIVLGTKKYGRENIVWNAVVLICSIEKRLKPRLELLELLEKMKLIEKWPSLSVISVYTDKKFGHRFVKPFLNQLEGVKFQTLNPRPYTDQTTVSESTGWCEGEGVLSLS